MTVKEAVEIVKKKEKTLLPCTCVETPNYYCFNLMNSNREIIATGGPYVVSKKDGTAEWINFFLAPEEIKHYNVIREYDLDDLERL